ncbi:sensor histidine kinase [Streptomyces sp. 1331.2]|uniref:sensor histidine kinase n=1 Tax=Streptomyces sp. 1331.2 TaxID=1938835 RepID=UPI000BC46623|nr:histidine kinase [Streptomyces sp. 1331.2]SOB84345.1 Signal transduction histidine kinase [Streptomyces sp. 1331.2]
MIQPSPGQSRGPSPRTRLASLLASLLRPSTDHTPLLAQARRPWVRYLPYAAALAAISSLLPSSINVLSHDYGLNAGLAAALSVAQTVPLLLAPTRPLAAWWMVGSANLLTSALTLTTGQNTSPVWPWPATALIGYLLLMLPLALREERRTLVAVWLATAGASLAFSVIGAVRDWGGDNSLLAIALTGAVLVLGGALRERAEARRLLTEQEQISEVERERRTLLEERARIARELHDVVAHHMSVIAVQAASAPYRIPDVPAEAAEEFTTIAGTARESLAEMRRLLGVLRSEESGGEKAPQPGVGQLDQLVETVGRAGVPAELSVDEGLVETVPQAVGLSAYRIVQEALANVVRHAPGARTWVSLSSDSGSGSASDGPALLVTVVNAPPPERTESLEASAEGTGHGLVGMRERVRLVDGRLDTGPLPDGGFKVAAVLPFDPLDTPRETTA